MENISVTATYTITLEHEGKLADMAERLGIKKSELIRRMIDRLYNEMEAEPENSNQPA